MQNKLKQDSVIKKFKSDKMSSVSIVFVTSSFL